MGKDTTYKDTTYYDAVCKDIYKLLGEHETKIGVNTDDIMICLYRVLFTLMRDNRKKKGVPVLTQIDIGYSLLHDYYRDNVGMVEC